LSPVKKFQFSKLPCLGWRSADFYKVFFAQNVCNTCANILVLDLRFLCTFVARCQLWLGANFSRRRKNPFKKLPSGYVFRNLEYMTYLVVNYYKNAVCLNLFAALPSGFLRSKFYHFYETLLMSFFKWKCNICEQKLLIEVLKSYTII
jgi:hypothetical protein